MVAAIFIDGVGNVVERLADGHPIVRIPMPTSPVTLKQRSVAMATFQAAEFECIGKLRDGRYIYTQVEARLEHWRWKRTVSMSVRAADYGLALKEADAQFEKFKNSMGQPVRVLVDVETKEGATANHVRRAEGVGRKR